MPSKKRQLDFREQVGPDTAWVTIQMIIFVAAAVGGPAGYLLIGRPDLPWHRVIDIIAGIIVIFVGLQIAGQAQRDLGESMRVAPTPLDDATFVDRGWYGRVRHPLYLSAFIVGLGWMLIWPGIVALAVTLVAFVFFSLKARHEERLLVKRYPEYDDYMRRVRWRFVPGVW